VLLLMAAVQTAEVWGERESIGLLGLLVLAFAFACRSWRCRPRRLDLYQHGIDYCVAGRHRHVLWHQIAEIYQLPLQLPHGQERSHTGSSSWMYRLVCRDGRVLRLYNLEGIRSLALRIQKQVARRQVPLALDAFRTGYAVRFGRWLAVSLDGIHVGRRFVPWHDISEITLDESRDFEVMRLGNGAPALRIPTARVANLFVLDEVLQAARGQSQVADEELDIAQLRDVFREDARSIIAGESDGPDPLVSEGWSSSPGDEGTDDARWPDLMRALSHRPRQPR
jgi:hypothetical protein